MLRSVTFNVPFVKGQHRPRVKKVGRGVQVYKCRQDREAEAEIAKAFILAGGKLVPEGAEVTVCIETRRNVLSSFRVKDGSCHPDLQKPDVDNIAKLVLDALNEVAYQDDSQVSQLAVLKHQRERGATPKTIITILWEE